MRIGLNNRGGDPLTARFMRQDLFTFMPTHKLFIVGNNQPNLTEVDDAARRRFQMIPSEDRPARQTAARKLRGEYPAILRWMIGGAGLYVLSC